MEKKKFKIQILKDIKRYMNWSNYEDFIQMFKNLHIKHVYIKYRAYRKIRTLNTDWMFDHIKKKYSLLWCYHNYYNYI